MHDVLDPRDLVPDEAEQLTHSGYGAGILLEEARSASAAGDLAQLSRIEASLSHLVRDPRWTYDEPDDDESLGSIVKRLPRLAVDPTQLEGRIRGAWLGRTVGNTLGKPVEGLTRREVETYLRAVGQWPQMSFVPLLADLPEGVSHLHESASFSAAGTFTDVPRDDDIDWTILGLHMLETYGRELTTEQIAASWLDRLPFTQTFTAERAAYRNLIGGLKVGETATHRNPYREWIGALIRADIFGYTNPGNPAEAARLALVDARLSHVANGIYGEIWAAALVASAMATSSSRKALESALKSVPENSRLAESLRGVFASYDSGMSAHEALDQVEIRVGHYNWVHTIHNAAHIAIGLLWGSDFTDTLAITISAGLDTDSAAATVGSVFGALHGSESIPQHLIGTTHHRVRSAVRDFDRITIDELVTRTMKLATEVDHDYS